MGIEQPRWKVPEYSKRQINSAGDVLRNNVATEEENEDALKVVDNWRAAHAYPLHIFYMNLRRKADGRTDILVAERLKRLESITGKLQRENSMQLYRMQDLGGCRMVLPTVEEVYYFSDEMQNSRIRHELKKVNDYIEQPKRSGYRSLHMVYRFKTETPGKEIYNQYPMLIELQFRTRLQHIWATALETMGLFTNQRLKASQGNEEILRFFVVMSSLFAIKENRPIVPETVNDQTELVSEIEQINDQCHILDILRAIRVAIEQDDKDRPDRRGYYILELNYETHMLRSWFFAPSDLDDANKFYNYLENKRVNKPLDIVMVRAASYRTVKAAYPNYFLDIGEFIQLVEEYLH